jgi:hypothetical protein
MCYSIVRYSLRALGEEHLGLELADLFDCCASAFITGNGSAGSAAFTKSDEVSCDDAEVVDQLTCTDASGRSWFNYWVWSFRGYSVPRKVNVYNADGLQLGAIVITGSCTPIGIKAQC